MRRIEKPGDQLTAARVRKSREKSAARVIEVRHEGDIFAVQVRSVANARRFVLRVRNATRDAMLTMPRRAALKDAVEFAARNAAWLAVRLRRLPDAVPFEHGAMIPVRGAPTRIVSTGLARGGARLENSATGAVLVAAGETAHVARRVRDFLKIECRADLRAAVDRYAKKIDAPPPAIQLRDTTSRWGSCSSAGALNFSWRLIMAPPYVLDYLAAHEVCHLRHMNHSKSFWDLARSICPHVQEAETWLRAHGAGLHKYGASGEPHANGSED